MLKDSKSVIILLSGKAESGKDTCAEFIRRECGTSGCRLLSFAKPVKEFATLLGWDGEKDEKGRALLQWLGDGVKKFNKDLWTIKGAATVLKLKSLGYRVFIFTDCRYFDEISFFKDRYANVFVVRVNRPKHISKLTKEQLEHRSECELDNYDFDASILNDDNVTNFEKNTINAFRKIRILGNF